MVRAPANNIWGAASFTVNAAGQVYQNGLDVTYVDGVTGRSKIEGLRGAVVMRQIQNENGNLWPSWCLCMPEGADDENEGN